MARPAKPGGVARGLCEQGVPGHRLRVEHDAETLLIHLSDETGPGWTTVAIDRVTREWAVVQRDTQEQAGTAAYELLYGE